MVLEGNESAKVLVRLQAQDFFAESPRMLIRTASVAQTLKLPITLLRICHPPSRESPSETLSALSSYAISDDFNGMNPKYTRMTQIIEAISYEGRFQAYSSAKVPALGKTGVLICAECLGQAVACKAQRTAFSPQSHAFSLDLSIRISKSLVGMLRSRSRYAARSAGLRVATPPSTPRTVISPLASKQAKLLVILLLFAAKLQLVAWF